MQRGRLLPKVIYIANKFYLIYGRRFVGRKWAFRMGRRGRDSCRTDLSREKTVDVIFYAHKKFEFVPDDCALHLKYF
jgi:hypothetical protein